MARYLSDEWFAEYERLGSELPVKQGHNVTLQYVVTGGPDGDVRYYQKIEDGRITAVKAGDAPSPDVTLTMKLENAAKIQMGEIDPNKAFMTGKMKPRGNVATLMKMMPLTSSPEYKEMERQVRELTEL